MRRPFLAFETSAAHAVPAIAAPVGRHDVAAAIAPFLTSECNEDAPEWRAAVAAIVDRAAAKAKNPAGEQASALYEKRWRKTSLEQFLLGRAGDVPCRWGDRCLLIRQGGLKRLYVLYLYRLIAALAPMTVLEIGCGAGLNITLMANRFPQVTFTGLELAQAGVEQCRRIAGDALPTPLVDFSPEPLVSRTAHQRARFHRGDAARLPYRDNSFDLVVTVLALEQMERIRNAALAELARVCRHWAVMIEPFRDWNADGARRRYVEAMGYLAAPVEELERYGLQPVFVTGDFPAKLNLGVGVVVARKARSVAGV
jgi:SAM-dependent methyltransferase